MTRKHDNKWLTLAVLAGSLAMIVLDGTIVGVSLPAMIQDLRMDLTQRQWVNSLYAAVMASLLMTAAVLDQRIGGRPHGRWADPGRHGRRRLPVRGSGPASGRSSGCRPDGGAACLAPMPALVGFLVLYGLGLGLVSARLTSTVLRDIPTAASGQGSATQSTVRQLGSGLGTVIAGSVLAVVTTREATTKLEALSLPGINAADWAQKLSDSAGGLTPAA